MQKKKPCNFDQKIPMKILSHYQLILPSKNFMILMGFLQNLFPVEESLVKMPNKRKKRERKAKEVRRRDSESER